jgi:type IV secretion system protein VirB3
MTKIANKAPDEEALERDVLHVAACRPAMVWGIPLIIIIPVIVTCLEVELATGFQMALIVDPPLIIASIIMVKHDYNAPRLWFVWMITKAKILDDYYYGGTAAAAFPIKPSRRQPRGTPSHVW